MKTMDTTDKIIYILGLILFGMGGLLFILYHFNILVPTNMIPECSFHKITGFYCPGCGGTRSLEAFFHGDILKSLSYHPIVLYSFVWYTCYLLANTRLILARLKQKRTGTEIRIRFPFFFGMRFEPLFVYFGIALLLLQCILKNILGRPLLH